MVLKLRCMACQLWLSVPQPWRCTYNLWKYCAVKLTWVFNYRGYWTGVFTLCITRTQALIVKSIMLSGYFLIFAMHTTHNIRTKGFVQSDMTHWSVLTKVPHCFALPHWRSFETNFAWNECKPFWHKYFADDSWFYCRVNDSRQVLIKCIRSKSIMHSHVQTRLAGNWSITCAPVLTRCQTFQKLWFTTYFSRRMIRQSENLVFWDFCFMVEENASALHNKIEFGKRAWLSRYYCFRCERTAVDKLPDLGI